LQFGVKHPESGVRTQLHIEILTFKSFPGLSSVEHTLHCICFPFEASDDYFSFEPAGGRAGLPLG